MGRGIVCALASIAPCTQHHTVQDNDGSDGDFTQHGGLCRFAEREAHRPHIGGISACDSRPSLWNRKLAHALRCCARWLAAESVHLPAIPHLRDKKDSNLRPSAS